MTDLGDLAFHLEYHLREISCKETQCPRPWPCGAVHRTRTGEATLTLAGPDDLIRRAAAAVFPDLAKVFNPPKAVEPTGTCDACGTVIDFDGPRCSDCVRGGWTPVPPQPDGRALSVAELDAMPAGAIVVAGAFPDTWRADRVRWIKLPTGRWGSPASGRIEIAGAAGVSTAWLANNRNPVLDTSSDNA